MKVELFCTLTVFITEDNTGNARYYVTHKLSNENIKSKGYPTIMDMLNDLQTLDMLKGEWLGVTGFNPGGPSIPVLEKITTQIGFKACFNNGRGTISSIIIAIKRQGQPNLEFNVIPGDVTVYTYLTT